MVNEDEYAAAYAAGLKLRERVMTEVHKTTGLGGVDIVGVLATCLAEAIMELPINIRQRAFVVGKVQEHISTSCAQMSHTVDARLHRTRSL